VQLSLKRAVDVAVSPEGSARVQLADEALKQAQARALEQRAALLPNVDAAFTDQSRTENLAAQGFSSSLFRSIPIPNFSFPSFVGPFTTVDARVTGTQSVFDFSTIRRYQASKVGVTAARSDADATQEQVASQVARAYLAAVRGDADVETALSNVTLYSSSRKTKKKPAPGRESRSPAPKCNWPTTANACWWRRTPVTAPTCNSSAPSACASIRNWN
jgi:outer membrane protein TolC